MKTKLYLVAVVVVLLAPSLPLHAQEPKPLPETKIVLKVSRKFLQCLVGYQFQHEEPIDTQVGRIAVAGKAQVTGKFRVVLRESDSESDFDVLANGEVATQMTAVRRPVVVRAHGTAPFSARRRFVQKDDKYGAEAIEIDVRHHLTLDEICSFRRGLIGATTRRLAEPSVRRSLADGDRQADDEIRTQLTQAMERELDRLTAALNQVQPLVFQAHELVIAELKLPKEGVRSYRAATKDHLLFSVGKPERRMPKLPVLDKDKQAPVELWIAESKNEAKQERRKLLLQNWRLIVPILLMQIEQRTPELAKEVDAPLAKLLDDVQLYEVPGWHIVAFAPKIHPAIKVP